MYATNVYIIHTKLHRDCFSTSFTHLSFHSTNVSEGLLLSARFKGAGNTRWIRSLHGAPQLAKHCLRPHQPLVITGHRGNAEKFLPTSVCLKSGSPLQKKGFLSWILEVEWIFSSEPGGMSFRAEKTVWQMSGSMRERSWRYSCIQLANIVQSLPHPRLRDKAVNGREQNNRSLCPHRPYVLAWGRQTRN